LYVVQKNVVVLSHVPVPAAHEEEVTAHQPGRVASTPKREGRVDGNLAPRHGLNIKRREIVVALEVQIRPRIVVLATENVDAGMDYCGRVVPPLLVIIVK